MNECMLLVWVEMNLEIFHSQAYIEWKGLSGYVPKWLQLEVIPMLS